MVELKTSKEKAEIKRQQRKERDEKIYGRFLELSQQYSLSDAVCIVANEFGLSLPTVYGVRKRMSNQLTEES